MILLEQTRTLVEYVTLSRSEERAVDEALQDPTKGISLEALRVQLKEQRLKQHELVLV